jgi:hypothetical protein
MPHTYTEDQLVEQPAFVLAASLLAVLDGTFNGDL